MARLAVARIRLRSHGLAKPPFPSVAAVVSAFGAVQAQDYAGALWGIAQRASGATMDDVERAIAGRAIVRTWPMRGTLHFVAPELVRGMLRELTPRVVRRAASRYEQLGLDAATFAKSRRVFERALAKGPSTRAELFEALSRAKIEPREQRGIHLIGHAAMQGLVCFGERRGKQPTFVPLDAWLPNAPALAEDELFAELARRFFRTHGPATAHDFAWWTGLTLRESRRAIESVAAELETVELDDRVLYGGGEPISAKGVTHLLPPWDEYTVGYQDRSDIVRDEDAKVVRGGVLSPVIAIDGQIVATWTRKTTGKDVVVHAKPFRPLSASAWRSVDAQIARYGSFAGIPARRAPG
jgi:hypothetical protein